MKLPFKQAHFVTSALKENEWPASDLPEIAFVGRSNVGKSSLLNHLLNHKSLAKVSSKPGKTQRINYFLIDDKLHIVDLPGYGYAKVNHTMKREWGQYLEAYLTNRKQIRLIVLLLDIRRKPSAEDLEFAEWAKLKKIPIALAFTKTDKVLKKDRQKHFDAILREKSLSGFPLVHYSIKEGKCRRELIEIINKTTWD